MRNPTLQPKRIGKFEIRRLLGTGAQSVVYLAYDAHLQREVAIKSLHLDGRDETSQRMLLEEARTVGKLHHPHIVPVFDAGEQDGDPYLVFEYVEGQTLAELLRSEGALPAPRAVELMRPILDAIGHAHHHGVIHRDLKPSNILINGEGVPRVMDFGIALRASQAQGQTDGVLGTPAYLAPERITEGTASAQSDIFAAGLILCEMLTGRKRLIQGDNVHAVLNRLAHEPVRLPAEAAGLIDEKLGHIILKATAMDPAARYASAAGLGAALAAWLTPREEEANTRPETGKQPTLDFLLRRMRRKSDFPALSEAICAINRIASSEQESVSTLSNAILKDVALTNKLMRLVNSASYAQAGGGAISTISRAVIILGFGAVRTIATSLILMEHLQNRGQATQLRDEFVRAIMTGILARDMARKGLVKDCEEAFICAMFHNLGRMLTYYYFPDETAEIAKLMARGEASEATVSAKVLGISYEDLGVGVARSWGFPEQTVASMRRLLPGSVKRPGNNSEKLQVLAGLSDQLCSVLETAPPEKRQEEIRKIGQRFGDSIPFDERGLAHAMDRSLEEMAAYAAAVRLNLQQTLLGRKVSARGGATPEESKAASPAVSSIPGDITRTIVIAPSEDAEAPAAGWEAPTPTALTEEQIQAILNAGIQDITRSLVEDVALADILRIIVETMYRGIGFQRILLCIKDVRQNAMVAKFGFGPEVEEVTRRFKFPLGAGRNIFEVALSRGADVLISDTGDPKIRPYIPEWFQKYVTAQTFILFPLIIRNAPVGLIYADKARAGELVIPENILSMLRALRNQAVLAIKQSR